MKEKTTLNREEFLKAINLVRPALASQAFIPSLTHVQFSDDRATAYNDITAISVKCPFEFDACLPGDLLIKILNSLSSDEIVVSRPDGNNLQFAGGRSKLKIPTLAIEDFPFDLPKENFDLDDEFPIGVDLINGIEKCLISVGSDPTHPAQMGVTLESGGVLFSTNNHAISRYKSSETKIKLAGDVPVILPTFFCQQLISLARSFPKESIALELRSGALVAMIGSSEDPVAVLFTKILVDLEPMDFDKIINKHCSDSAIKKYAQIIPDAFDSGFERAMLILSNELDKSTQISIEDGKLRLLSKSTMGEADDSMRFKGEAEADEDFYVDPTLVCKVSKLCNKLAALKDVLVLTNEDGSFIHLIAHSASN